MKSFSSSLSAILDFVGWSDESTTQEPNDIPDTDEPEERGGECAHYRHSGVVFSRRSAHEGNSLIAYDKGGKTSYGSIKSIQVIKANKAIFTVRSYRMLQNGHKDRYSRYAPHFPVCLVSTEEGVLEDVPVSCVKCHCARYRVSPESFLMLELARVNKVVMTDLHSY
jgi:hypothetical protein